MLALRHPNEFDLCAGFPGFAEPTYKGDGVQIRVDGSKETFGVHGFLALVRTHRYLGPAEWSEAGSGDTGPKDHEARLATAVGAAGIETYSGGHDDGVWCQALVTALPGPARCPGLTSVAPSLTAACTQGKP